MNRSSLLIFWRSAGRAFGMPVGLIPVDREGAAREWFAWKLEPGDKPQAKVLGQ